MATTDFQRLSKADPYRQRQGLLGTATPAATGTTTAPTTSGTATTTQPTTTTSPSGATTQAGATTRPTRPGTGAGGQATGQTADGTGAADAGAITVSPEMWNVESNQLTSENLNKLLSEGSSYLDLARTGAAQTANARGLLNSSMAAGAGEAAAIASALPIAQSDASVYADAAKTNTGAKNTANMFNAGEKNKFGLQAAQNNFAAAQANLDRAQQVALADKSIAAQMALQKAQQEFTGAQNDLDRAQQLTIADKNIAANASLQAGQQSFQRGENAADRAQQMSVLSAQQNFASAQADLDRAQQVALADKSLASQMALQTAQQNFVAAQAGLDRAQQTSLTTLNQDFTATQNQLDRDNREELVKLQASLTQSGLPQTFAANIAGTALQGINGIMADPNMTPETKQGAVTNLINSANSTMQWGATFYNTPLPAIQQPGT